jgi:NADPH:quinone reductase-like Zn-dependent oxidoreductase
MLKPRVASWFGRQKFVKYMTQVRVADLDFFAEMAGDGRLEPFIERTYKLSQTAEGLTYLEQGHAMGKLVVTLESA